jgi:uncharacterized protein YhaN
VREAVARHIGALFPGAALHVDPARGDVSGLRTRHGAREVVETFDVLSIGAREQLGVLIRLGVASVLAGDRRLPIVLDDALVNTDDDRRRAMIDVLCEASERLQLLVFTCHEADYDRAAADRQFRVAGRGPRRP